MFPFLSIAMSQRPSPHGPSSPWTTVMQSRVPTVVTVLENGSSLKSTVELCP
jgi:hypothetical protein